MEAWSGAASVSVAEALAACAGHVLFGLLHTLQAAQQVGS